MPRTYPQSSDPQSEDPHETPAHAIIRFALRRAGPLLLGFFIVLTLLGSYYTVDQTEFAGVRRFGTRISTEPVGPGIHFKVPWIDSVDKLRVTLQTIHVPEFKVLTVDNQEVTIEENFNYTIPKAAVFHVLYEVGQSGNVDIEPQVQSVAHDRTARILADQNMVTVNSNREAIQTSIEAEIRKQVEALFGLEPHSLQVTKLLPSDAFMKSIDAATMAKNEAIKAENQLKTVKFQAQQQVATATGEADSKIQQARGQAEATKAVADAEKYRIEKEADGNRYRVEAEAQANKARLVAEGDGLKANLEDQLAPFGGDAKMYVAYVAAKAALNWKGDVPQITSGGGSSPNLIIPLPAPATANQ
jgi:modulator of FtsH protease HflC